jgi:hypothetical protein
MHEPFWSVQWPTRRQGPAQSAAVSATHLPSRAEHSPSSLQLLEALQSRSLVTWQLPSAGEQRPRSLQLSEPAQSARETARHWPLSLVHSPAMVQTAVFLQAFRPKTTQRPSLYWQRPSKRQGYASRHDCGDAVTHCPMMPAHFCWALHSRNASHSARLPDFGLDDAASAASGVASNEAAGWGGAVGASAGLPIAWRAGSSAFGRSSDLSQLSVSSASTSRMELRGLIVSAPPAPSTAQTGSVRRGGLRATLPGGRELNDLPHPAGSVTVRSVPDYSTT